MREIIVAVGSLNKAKLAGVQNAFSGVFTSIKILPVEVDSGVAAQPMTDEVSIQGATNRAKAALTSVPNADYGVGLEGNVDEHAGLMILRGWVVIVSKAGITGYGHSAGVEIPPTIAQRLRAGQELGPLMQQLLNDTHNTTRHSEGTSGVLTNGTYSRVDEFTHATQCALARFLNPDLYKK